jgi:hypothetical protein
MAIPRRIEITVSGSEYFALDPDQTFYFELEDKVIARVDDEEKAPPVTIRDIQKDLGWSRGRPKKAWDGEVVVTVVIDRAGVLNGNLVLKGRGHLCSCYRESFAALVVRAKISWNGTALSDLAEVEGKSLREAAATREEGNLNAFESDPLDPAADYYTGFREIYDAAWRILYRSDASDPLRRDPLEQGLIVVAGRTGSGKSNIARGIIHCALSTWSLRDRKTSDRNFHLVTFEDPVEKFLLKDPREAQKIGVDYTPRELNVDVTNLTDAMTEARRQTPSLYYLGEVRKDTDWKKILGFVEGGHLVVATTHAGSLVECFHKIMTGEDEKSPAARSRVCGLIRGILQIHRGHTRAIGPHKSKSFNIPTIWARTPEGVAAYVSNGSSAILPRFDEPGEFDLIPEELKEHVAFGEDDLCFKETTIPVCKHWTKGKVEAGGANEQILTHTAALLAWECKQVAGAAPAACSLGRRWFARDLARQVSVPYAAAWGKNDTEILLREIERKCIEWDLRGE